MAICECTLFVFWHVKDDVCCCVCHCAAMYHKTFPPLTSALHRVCVKCLALSLVILQYQLVTFYSFSGTIKFHITSPTKLFDGFPTSPSLVGHLSHLCSWGHKTGNGLLQVLKCFHLVYIWRFILISLRLVILRSSGPGRDHKVFSEWKWNDLNMTLKNSHPKNNEAEVSNVFHWRLRCWGCTGRRACWISGLSTSKFNPLSC